MLPATSSHPVPAAAPQLSIEQVIYVLKDPARWAIIKELLSGEARMVNELSRVIGKGQTATSKHLAALKSVGVVKTVRRLYQLSEQYLTGPGQTTIDFGHCLVRFH